MTSGNELLQQLYPDKFKLLLKLFKFSFFDCKFPQFDQPLCKGFQVLKPFSKFSLLQNIQTASNTFVSEDTPG